MRKAIYTALVTMALMSILVSISFIGLYVVSKIQVVQVVDLDSMTKLEKARLWADRFFTQDGTHWTELGGYAIEYRVK